MKFYKILVVVLGLLMFAGAAQAQKIKDQFIKPLPKVVLLSESEFNEKTQKIDRSSENDPPIGYEIRVPKDWKTVPDSSQEQKISAGNILGEIGKFFSPTGMDEPSYIQIHAISLDYQTTVEQWFLQYLIEGGYNIQGLKIYNETCAEALYVVVKNSISYAVRSVACINGKRVIFVEYYLPIDQWDAEKAMQAQVLNSFRLKKIVQEHVEKLAQTKLLDIVSVRYPESWKLNTFPIQSIERMKIQLLNITTVPDDHKLKSRLDGKVDINLVSVVSSETLEKEIERSKADLRSGGLDIKGLLESSVDLVVNPNFEFADTQVYKAGDKNNKLIEYELWLTAVSAGDYYYFVSLLTPGRDQNYAIWARNTQTYKLILDLIMPNPEKGLNNQQE